MNTLPLRLAVIAMLSVSTVTAQDADASAGSTDVRSTTELRPTKSNQSLQLSAAASQKLFDGQSRREGAAGTKPRYAEWVDDLVRWTEQLVAQLDPLGVLESPFRRYPIVADASPATGSSSGSASTWLSTPRLRPIRLGDGGYGVVARVTF